VTQGVDLERAYAEAMFRWLGWMLPFVLALVAFLPDVARADERDQERVLEGRLLAPCCWVQTLDVHESPLAGELRSEVHARLHAGEAVSVVEADLVARYGERIRAVPAGSDPRRGIGLASAGLVVVTGALLLWLFVRRVRRGRATTPQLVTRRDDYDRRLDEELAERVY